MEGVFETKVEIQIKIGGCTLKDKIEVGWDRVKAFCVTNRVEIIESVISENQNIKQGKNKKTKIEEKIEKERKTIKISLVLGTVYVVIGGALLWDIKRYNLFLDNNVIIGSESVALGIYALLHAFIFYCVRGRWREKSLVKVGKEILVILMLPYHLCIKGIKAFIRDKRQGHVIYLFPYYMLSLIIVSILVIIIGEFISNIEISEVYYEFVSFIIVCLFIFGFLGLGKGFAYLLTKSVIKSVQKTEIKRISKINWRGTLNNETHKKERDDKFNEEWKIVKNELQYTELYFYIILALFVLWIPIEDGTFTTLLVDQFWGITTIAALAREVKSKKDDEKKNVCDVMVHCQE